MPNHFFRNFYWYNFYRKLKLTSEFLIVADFLDQGFYRCFVWFDLCGFSAYAIKLGFNKKGLQIALDFGFKSFFFLLEIIYFILFFYFSSFLNLWLLIDPGDAGSSQKSFLLLHLPCGWSTGFITTPLDCGRVPFPSILLALPIFLF